MQNFQNAGFNIFKMYYSHVIPVMDYSSDIWGFQTMREWDKFQHRAARYYLGVHQEPSIFAIVVNIG